VNLSDLSNGNLLASDDYAVGTVFPLMPIERITTEEVAKPGTTKKEPKATVWFTGAKKGWVINKNEARKMAKIIGETKNIDKTWIGARVSLRVVGDVRRPDGTKGNAFRVAECLPAESPINPDAAKG
jgi:hypothetical protein